jgi:hypothetical protein
LCRSFCTLGWMSERPRRSLTSCSKPTSRNLFESRTIYVPRSADWAFVRSKGGFGGHSVGGSLVVVPDRERILGDVVATAMGARVDLSIRVACCETRRRFGTGWNSPVMDWGAATPPQDGGGDPDVEGFQIKPVGRRWCLTARRGFGGFAGSLARLFRMPKPQVPKASSHHATRRAVSSSPCGL